MPDRSRPSRRSMASLVPGGSAPGFSLVSAPSLGYDAPNEERPDALETIDFLAHLEGSGKGWGYHRGRPSFNFPKPSGENP